MPLGPAARIISTVAAIDSTETGKSAASSSLIVTGRQEENTSTLLPSLLPQVGSFPDTLSVFAAGLTTMPRLACDNTLSSFLLGMLSADVEETDNAIVLPPGIMWPDLTSRVLYKRPCYEGLWRSVLHEGRDEDLRGAVICGSPGIAKSVFGLMAIYRAVKDNRTVVYNSRKGGRAMFKGGVAYDIPTDLTNLPELNAPSTLYVSDSLPPVAYKAAFRLLITSPKKENWSSFTQSPGVQLFVLPMFSADEMIELRALAFDKAPCCSLVEVKEQIVKCGGSPRNAMTKAADPIWQDRLSTVLADLSLTVLQRSLRGSTALDGVGSDDQCHRLVNIMPQGALLDSELPMTAPQYYWFHHAEVVTSHAESLIAKSLLLQDEAELYRFLHRSADDPAIAGFRGVLYERTIAIPRITQGKLGNVSIQRLSPPLESCRATATLLTDTLNFSAALPVVHFRSVPELKTLWGCSGEDAIFVPLSKQFPVVDFVLRRNGDAILANATVAESHDIKVGSAMFSALLDAVGLQTRNLSAPDSREVPIVWVLPQEAFERFTTPGPLKGASSGDLMAGDGARHAIGKRIAQYKMLLAVP